MKSYFAILSLLIFITSGTTGFTQQKVEEPKYIENQVIVQLINNTSPERLPYLVPYFFHLKVKEQLSVHSSIWLLEFDGETANLQQVIRHLQQINNVRYAQPNRILQRRVTPNDPGYTNQWQNTIVDAAAAWNITTGGETNKGTDIVVALMESANVISHEDLNANQWVNVDEIPDNGIDDDNNGYIDDYNGWNVSTDDDDIEGGSHGTSCAGMIGAIGNNGIGVAGINWNVKIMVIAGYSSPFTEANIVKAYDYALNERLLWNQTGGNEGSFVVVTSASWGIDQGDPDDYPIWCGFYDDLGQAGILNCGATTNQNFDVDVVGDVPSGCSSDFMIGVTATNSSDIIDFAGYGDQTIDVAAPGSAIYTTGPNDTYKNTSGTSFATPFTAGLIGLMYSIPCNDLEDFAVANPEGAALLVRDALFDAVDKSAYLEARTITGGRINAKKSIDTLMARICNSCQPPFDIQINYVNENTASINYFPAKDAQNYTISYREVSSTSWIDTTITDTSFTFTDLSECTSYEFKISTYCTNGKTSTTTQTYSFTTKGCGNCVDLSYCESKGKDPAVQLLVTSPSSIDGSYSFEPTTSFGSDVSDGYVYGELVLVDDGSANPAEGCNPLTNGADVNGNIAVIRRGTCAFTSKVVNAQNAGATAAIIVNNVPGTPITMGGTDFSITIPAVMVSMADGDAIIDAINAASQPMAILGQQHEWIESFEINGATFNTGDNNGYEFTQSSISLAQGGGYSFTITPGFDAQPLTEYYRIWLDVNQNGTFETSELIYNSGTPSTTAISDFITVPTSATMGSTRMRVQMVFNGNSGSPLPPVCGDFTSGEVEDYCVEITEYTGLSEDELNNDILVYPNPTNGKVTISSNHNETLTIFVYSSNGKLVSNVNVTQSDVIINSNKWSPGIYFFHIYNQNNEMIGVKKVSVLP